MAGEGAVACLYFGYDLGELLDGPDWLYPDNEVTLDFDRELGRRAGWVEVLRPAGAPDWSSAVDVADLELAQAEWESTPEFRAWQASEQALRDLVRQCPIEMIYYGSIDNPKFAVLVVASVYQVEGYNSIEVRTPLQVNVDWNDKLHKFMSLMELEIPPSGPGWHLCYTDDPE